jgi:hypothetical protein
MSKRKSPQRWAFDLTHILNARDGAERFPVDVKSLARDYSHQIFPNDPVSLIQGRALDGFEGGLYKAPTGKIGWGIIYNSAIPSPGRINFTIAHELGHYLVHRHQLPDDGISCSAEDMANWDSQYGQIEQQANDFAATLLMPRDDFERQISCDDQPGFDELGVCAERYGVSLTAATLRWLQFTKRRSLLVVSRDGFVLWARSSPRALRTGAFFKTNNVPPVELHAHSLAAQPHALDGGRGKAEHDSFVWFKEPCSEETIASERYEMTYSLLHLSSDPAWHSEDESEQDDTHARMTSNAPRFS